MRQKIPEEIDYETTRTVLAEDPSPLNVVLLQEIQRYNSLMETMRLVLLLMNLLCQSSDRDLCAVLLLELKYCEFILAFVQW